MNNPRLMTSKQIMAAIQNGADLTQYDYVKKCIEECNDINKLRAMLLDTLENASNAGELADDLFEFYVG